jgi:hypothetical protein
MKRFVAVCLFIFVLSFPAFGGHTVAGDSYCECGTKGCVEDYPGECGGGHNAAAQPNDSPSDTSEEIGILLVALLFWLRLKA